MPSDRRAIAAKSRDVDALMATTVKHYVRRHVWVPAARQRQQRLGRPIRYFTLTTKEIYDIRLLERAGILQRTERGYPGVGFCEMDDEQHAAIQRRLGWCAWSYKGRFEEMVDNHPQFGTDFEFDVINLDFISVPFPDGDAPLSGTWGALRKLLQHQFSHSISFDLFLTFRGSRCGTDDGALREIVSLLESNLRNGRGAVQFEARTGHRDPVRLLSHDYVRFLCDGIPKLLAGEALTLGYKISRLDSFVYERAGSRGPYPILKFVLSLEVPSRSPGFADPPAIVADYDALVPVIFGKSPVDVGALLGSDQQLSEEVASDLAALRPPDAAATPP